MKQRMKGGPRNTITSLAVMVKAVERGMWPTPNSRDYKGSPGAGLRERGGHQSSLPASVGDSGANGRLNPTWVEWLMGFPLGWTDLGRSATRSSRKSRSSSAGASSNGKKAA
jgi:DNA (cytosine-5)-methyltransferase 1